MYELERCGEQSFYLDSPSRIGIYVRKSGEAYLIDSGVDDEAARRAEQVIKDEGWNLKGIINTHAHADHIGGNKYLQKKYGCDIFAADGETHFIKYPAHGAASIFGGNPPKELLHKLLYAEESEPKSIFDEGFPKELKAVPLPGHSYDMIGVLTPDGTFFIGDAVSNPAGLEKYRIVYVFDVGKFVDTLGMLENFDAKMFVSSHAPAVCDIREYAKINREWIMKNAADLMEFSKDGASAEELVKAFFDKYGLLMSYVQYSIMHASIMSYLTWMKERREIVSYIEGNRILYRAER